MEKESNSDNLLSSIDYNNDKNWQFIIASQNYGTTYAIYAKFTIIKEKDGETRREIQFKIRNYKGQIQLGIYDVIFNKTNGQIDILVQALNRTRTTESYNFNFEYKIGDKDNRLKIVRYLIPMFLIAPNKEFSKKDLDSLCDRGSGIFCKKYKYFDEERNRETTFIWYAIYKSIFNFEDDNIINESFCVFCDQKYNSKASQIAHNHTGIIDTEFFHVDGDNFVIAKYDYDEDPKDIAQNFDGTFTLAGFRCKQSTLTVDTNN
ncbi:hypothetical protein GCM10011344_07410 [Dokdonia pacifica]|uniref:Uncharacterized protein n=1 Tax=Dokdonia pacifica TaxID=1627892 RepID=A0A238YZM7_9FLAO|nr:hypothetical protein [Dokdonia pacifica]GGG09371.1 hypothetical protein GCM10011344_07410 [Dokdonia pacifica]SNR76104.1 hypothetical protein SAMN06265376_102460 [Dokdonia pacifica]